MKGILLFSVFAMIFILESANSFAKDGENARGTSGKTYIFNYDVSLQECNEMGNNPAATQIIPLGSTFRITHITATSYVIVINEYTLPKNNTIKNYNSQLDKRSRLNFKSNPLAGLKTLSISNDNVKHFLLSNDEFITYASERAKKGSWNYGTLIQPFKFRSSPSLFTSDFSLGGVIGYERPIKSSGFSVGLFGGLSLSKVTLDSFSTAGKVKTNTDRPAFTPSFNVIIGYKNTFSITAGIGWDLINKTSDIEKSWAYAGHRWFGLGIGIKLFTPNTGNDTPKEDQK